VKKRIKLTFPQHLIKEPVLFTLAKTYDITPNIKRARVTDTLADMVVDLDGDESNLEKAIQALIEQDVKVEADETAGQ
jgi:L-aspartate semialdehyde sulfurtransferase ferredoxin